MATAGRHPGRVDLHADVAQHARRHLAIDRFILDQQDAAAGEIAAQLRLGITGAGYGWQARAAFGEQAEPGEEPEGAADAGGAASRRRRRPSVAPACG